MVAIVVIVEVATVTVDVTILIPQLATLALRSAVIAFSHIVPVLPAVTLNIALVTPDVAAVFSSITALTSPIVVAISIVTPFLRACRESTATEHAHRQNPHQNLLHVPIPPESSNCLACINTHFRMSCGKEFLKKLFTCRCAPNRLGRIDGGGTVEALVAWARAHGRREPLLCNSACRCAANRLGGIDGGGTVEALVAGQLCLSLRSKPLGQN